MMRVMSVLWLGVILSMAVFLPAAQAQSNPSLPCQPADPICSDDLWGNSLGRFTIKEIKAASDIPIYANPLLTVTITINNRPSNATWRLYSSYQNYPSTNDYCELLLVGLGDNSTPPNYVDFVTVPPDRNEFTVNVFGFCRNMNLPGTAGERNKFPDSSFTAQASDFTRLDSADSPDELASLVQRTNNNTCGEEGGLRSILTQFAVYILYTAPNEREAIWRDFQEKARNPLYGSVESENRIYIYCLLEEAGIPTPAPTDTPTPLPTITLTPTQTPLISPTPTHTPVPFLEMTVVPPPPLSTVAPTLSIGRLLGVALMTLIGGVLLFVLWLTLKRRERLLVIVSVVALSLAVIYLLSNRPEPEMTPPDETARTQPSSIPTMTSPLTRKDAR